MGDVIDLDSKRPHVPVLLGEVDEDADMDKWVDRLDDGSITVCWSEGAHDAGLHMSKEKALALSKALEKKACSK